jgi:hypothetical protein
MTGEAFRAQLRNQPFRPFIVKTADGDTFRVEHPDYAMVSPRHTEVIIYEKDNHYHVIALDLVVSLEPTRNGQHRKPGKR